MERGEIPGATLLVRKEGKEEVYLESGYADIEAKKPVARDSIYRLYSMSKPITAVAVMLLAERGQIDLADPVCRYLPGFCGSTGGLCGWTCGKTMARCEHSGPPEYDFRSGV